MEHPEEACRFIKQCGTNGKISDECFTRHDSARNILERFRAAREVQTSLDGTKAPLDAADRLDLLENHLQRMDTCIDSILSMLSQSSDSIA